MLQKRLVAQEFFLARRQRKTSLPPLRRKLFDSNWWVNFFIRLVGLSPTGRRNFLQIRVVRRNLPLPGLPPAFSGFRVLQISDLHCDLEPEIINRTIERIQEIEFDQVVITGDFQDRVLAPHAAVLELVGKLIPHLGSAPLAVPGNHDLIELVDSLEELGLRFLCNESICLQKNGDRLYLAGVDDPYLFETFDFPASRSQIPRHACSILLAHSPEVYREAEEAGYAAMLCGHTHGGQICLPGGIAIWRNAKVPRRMLAGPWQWRQLRGYTSRGTGGCGVPARFFCPPEITLHTLQPT